MNLLVHERDSIDCIASHSLCLILCRVTCRWLYTIEIALNMLSQLIRLLHEAHGGIQSRATTRAPTRTQVILQQTLARLATSSSTIGTELIMIDTTAICIGEVLSFDLTLRLLLQMVSRHLLLLILFYAMLISELLALRHLTRWLDPLLLTYSKLLLILILHLMGLVIIAIAITILLLFLIISISTFDCVRMR